jgi:hypothetical protein
MSMSVGASSSTNALAYLQQLVQQATAGASSAGATDPLSELMQTSSGFGSGSDLLTSPSADAAAGSGSSAQPPFGSDTMAQLLSLQGQGTQANSDSEQAFLSQLDTDGTSADLPATASASASTSASGDGSSANSSSNGTSSNPASLIGQLITMQSQMLSAMSSSASMMSIAV